MKKILSLILAFAFIFTLTACGGKEAPAKAPSWQEQYDLGIKYLNDGNYEEAIIAFTAAIEIEERAEFFIGRGKAYSVIETAENFAKAEEDFKKAVSLEENNRDAYINWADVLIKQNKPDEAVDVLKDALEKLGEDEEISQKIEEIEGGNYSDFSGNIRRETHYDGEGNFKFYITKTYFPDYGERCITVYDKDNNVISLVDATPYANEGNFSLGGYPYEDETGKILNYEIVKLDENGNRIISKKYDMEGNYTRNYSEYKYDAKGNQTEYLYYNEDKLFLKYVYQYDENGQIILSECYNENGNGLELDSYNTYEYDSNGNEIKEIDYLKDGTIYYYVITEYYEDGRKKKNANYDTYGNLQGYYTYTYLEDGGQITEHYDGNNNLMERTEYN